MHVDHHDLHLDFPEMGDVIAVLRDRNPLFARLYGTYNRLTGNVENLEEHDMPVGDFTLEAMKKQRVKVKDDLYHLMLAYRLGQQTQQTAK